MAAKMNIPNLENASKQEEIDFLHALAGALSKDSYLSSLFSDRLVTWATEQIRNDFTCDIWDLEVSRLMQELNQKSAELTVEQRDNQRLQRDVKALKERIDAAGNYAAEQIEFLNKAIINRDDQIAYLTDRNAELATGFNDATAKIAERDRKIQELKARIYDLEHPEV